MSPFTFCFFSKPGRRFFHFISFRALTLIPYSTDRQPPPWFFTMSLEITNYHRIIQHAYILFSPKKEKRKKRKKFKSFTDLEPNRFEWNTLRIVSSSETHSTAAYPAYLRSKNCRNESEKTSLARSTNGRRVSVRTIATRD